MFPLLDNIFNYLPVFYPESDQIIDENNDCNFYQIVENNESDNKFYDEYDYEDFEREEKIKRYEYRERHNKITPYENLMIEHQQKLFFIGAFGNKITISYN